MFKRVLVSDDGPVRGAAVGLHLLQEDAAPVQASTGSRTKQIQVRKKIINKQGKVSMGEKKLTNKETAKQIIRQIDGQNEKLSVHGYVLS